ncbi:MAG TPA: Grx4 family monothiol glutaredoxin [Polyangiaceae bacterium]|nr:Grx4 family monothiol glutaredoxin [Polyangiaceae bacterium]
MTPEVEASIQKAISTHEVVLFLKGTRSAPSCGFSARTVEVLDSLLENYATVDVLAHPEIREGIKEFSDWPTIPQLFVRGEFLGGADIVAEMFESGALHEKLGLTGGQAAPPRITVSERAATALRGYLGDSGEVILLDIGRDFHSGLSLGPQPAQAVTVVSGGLTLAMDRLTAGRADGLLIDFVDTPEGQAFKLDNPNEPARVRPLSVQALAQQLKAGVALRLIDVRSPGEWETARIEGAELLDSALHDELVELAPGTVLVFQCHHGHRSQRAAEQFVARGFRQVFNLTGGIDAWSLEVDPNVPRY